MSSPAFADIIAMMRSPLPRAVTTRGRYVAGTLAAAGSLAVFFASGGTAEAKTAHSGSSTTVQAAKPKAANVTYTIKRGDTLSSIALRNNTTVAAIVTANHLASADKITAGATLTIPRPGTTSTTPASSTANRSSGRGTAPTDPAVKKTVTKLQPVFRQAAAEQHVPASLLQAMTWNESGWQNHVVSGVGAMGVGQLMPDTVKFINESLVNKPLDPRKTDHNIRMSAAYLRYLLDETNGDYRLALAAYYQGLHSVQQRGMYDDTKQYINTVLALQKTYF